MHLPVFTDVARYFKADGYEVFADVTLEGATGEEHAPQLFCEREDGWLVVTTRDVLTGRDVVDAFTMAKDCDARAACHGVRVTPDAARWAARLGVLIVDDARVRALACESAARTELALAVAEDAATPEPAPALAPHLTALAAHARELPEADAPAVPLPAPTPPPAPEPVVDVTPTMVEGLVTLAAEGAALAPLTVDRVLARVPTVDFAAFEALPAPLPLPTAFDIGVPEPVEEDAREVALAAAVARWDEEMLEAEAALPWAVPATEEPATDSPLPWAIPATPRAAPGHVPVDALTPEARAARELLWGTADAPASQWLATLAPRRVLQR